MILLTTPVTVAIRNNKQKKRKGTKSGTIPLLLDVADEAANKACM
jgi:hypothetical protein